MKITTATTITTGAGATLIGNNTIDPETGEIVENAVIETLALNGDGNLAIQNMTMNITGTEGTVNGELSLTNMMLTGNNGGTTTGKAKSLKFAGEVTLKDIKLETNGDPNETTLADGSKIIGNSNEKVVLTTDKLSGGASELKNLTFNVAKELDLNGVTLDNANLNFNATDSAIGKITGNLETFPVSKINIADSSSSIELAGDFTVHGTTNILGSGNFIPKGSLIFDLDDDLEREIEKRNGYTFLTTDTPMDLSTLSSDPVSLIQTNKKYDKLKKGETMTLITNVVKDSYLGKKRVKTSGGLRKFVYSVAIEEVPEQTNVTEEHTMSLLASPLLGAEPGEDDKKYALILGYLAQEATPQTKSFTQSKFALTAAINDAGDLIATNVMDNVSPKGKDWETFAVVGGSNSRYDEVSSNVTLNMFNVAAGLSKVVFPNLTLGIFAEGGNGRYDTSHNFVEDEVASGVSSKGDINYFGGGLFAKWEGKETNKGQFHSEVSMRAGRINSKYNSNNFDPEIPYLGFDLSGAYLGAHAGFGYKWLLKSGNKIDTYVKYLWSRQCNTNRTILEEELTSIDGIDSHRARIGFRYYGKEDENGLTVFGGLAYEHEFDGRAKGHFVEYPLPEPDMEGGSGMAEFGVKLHKGNSLWRGEFAVQGHAGRRRNSVGVNLGLWYEIPHKKKNIEQAQEKFEEKKHDNFEQKLNNSELKQEKLEQEIKKIGYQTEK